MKKKVRIHMLPTGDITGIVLHSTGLDKIVHTKESELNAVLNIGGTSQHLYLTSNEKIEVGDSVISKLYGLGKVISSQWADNRGKTPMLVQFEDIAIMYGKDGSYKDDGNKIYLNDCYKIVATTDKSLYNPKTIQYGNMLLYDTNDDGSYYYCKNCEVEFSLRRDELIQLGLIVPQIPQSFIKQYVEAGGKIDEVELEIEETFTSTYTEGRMKRFYSKSKIKTDSDNCAIIHTVKDSWSREEVEKLLLLAFNANRHSIARQEDWIKENMK